jgi:hypothetical protein
MESCLEKEKMSHVLKKKYFFYFFSSKKPFARVCARKNNSRADILLRTRSKLSTRSLAMPKHECSGVLGQAARKALTARKAIKKGSGKAQTKKGASSSKPPEKPAPTTLEVVSADEHVSASPTPPTPSSPRSPSYQRESWWDSFSALSRRIDETSEALKDLKEYVKRLEEECEKERVGVSVFGKRG